MLFEDAAEWKWKFLASIPSYGPNTQPLDLSQIVSFWNSYQLFVLGMDNFGGMNNMDRFNSSGMGRMNGKESLV